jgi:hypothetical protein
MLDYEKAFNLLNDTVLLFNRRVLPGEAPCKCHHINMTVNISQSLQSHIETNDPNQWIGMITSEQFGSRRFGGTIDRVKELMSEYLYKTAFEIIQSLALNKHVWYSDPADHSAIDELVRMCHE